MRWILAERKNKEGSVKKEWRICEEVEVQIETKEEMRFDVGGRARWGPVQVIIKRAKSEGWAEGCK